MKTQIIDPLLVKQTSFDSSSPGGLSIVAHRFREPGDYVVSFRRRKEVTDHFYLEVSEKKAKRTRLSPMAVTIFSINAFCRKEDFSPGGKQKIEVSDSNKRD